MARKFKVVYHPSNAKEGQIEEKPVSDKMSSCPHFSLGYRKADLPLPALQRQQTKPSGMTGSTQSQSFEQRTVAAYEETHSHNVFDKVPAVRKLGPEVKFTRKQAGTLAEVYHGAKSSDQKRPRYP